MSEPQQFTRAEIMMPGVACIQESAPHDRQSASAQRLAASACNKCLQQPHCLEQAEEIAMCLGATKPIIIGARAVQVSSETIAAAQTQEPSFAFAANKPPGDPEGDTQHFRVLYRHDRDTLRPLVDLEKSVLPMVVGQIETPENFTPEDVSRICEVVTQVVSSGDGFPISTVQHITEAILKDAATYLKKGATTEEALNDALKFGIKKEEPEASQKRNKSASRVKVTIDSEPLGVRTKRLEHKKLKLLMKDRQVTAQEVEVLSDRHAGDVVRALEEWPERAVGANAFTQVRQRARKSIEELLVADDVPLDKQVVSQMLRAELVMAMSINGAIRRSPRLGMQLAKACAGDDLHSQMTTLQNVEDLLAQRVITINRTKDTVALALHPALQGLSDKERYFFIQSNRFENLFREATIGEYSLEEVPDGLNEKIKLLIAANHESAQVSPLEQGISDMLAEAVDYFGGRYTEDKEGLLEQLVVYCGHEHPDLQTNIQFDRFLMSLGKAYRKFYQVLREDTPMTEGELVLAGMLADPRETSVTARSYAEVTHSYGFDTRNNQLRESFAYAFDEFLDGIEQDHRLQQQRKALVRQWRLNDPEVIALFERVPETPKDISELNVQFAKRIEAGKEAKLILNSEQHPPDELAVKYGVVPDQPLSDQQKFQLERIAAQGDRSRKEFIEANIRLGISIALLPRFRGRGLEPIELINQSILGIGRAVDKYDYHRGTTFATYATYWVVQELNRTLANTARTIRLPVKVENERGQVYRARRQLTRTLNDEPTYEQIAAKTGFTPQYVAELFSFGKTPDSFSRLLGSDNDKDSGTLGDMIADSRPEEGDAFDDLVDAVDSGFLRKIILDLRQSETAQPQKGTAGYTAASKEYKSLLTDREFQVLWKYFGFGGEPQSRANIAESLGVSRQEIHRLQDKALDKLRTCLLERVS